MPSFLDNWKKVIDAGLFPYVDKATINAINDYLDYNKGISDGLNTRLTSIENNETVYQLFEYVGKSTTGQVTIPAEATIFDLYGDGILDAIAVVADENNSPTEENSINAVGEIVQVTSLDSNGVYTLDSTPTLNSCLVFYIKIKDQYKSNVNETSIVSIMPMNLYHAVGIVDISVPNFTNNGDGTITIESANVGLRSDINHVSDVKRYTIPEATLSLVDNAENYVYADYNNSSPIYKSTTDVTLVNGSNASLMYVMWRVGNVVHSADQDSIGLGLPNKINTRMLKTEPYKISSDGGLEIAETATPTNRTIVCTGALVFKGVAPEVVLSFNSSVDSLVKVIKTAGGTWTYTQVAVYDNTGYNPDGLGEVALGNSKFGYRLFYRSIGDDQEIFYVQSKSEYNSIDAARTASELGRDVPIVLQKHCILVGRALIEQNATNGVTENFVQRTGYFISPIPTHNSTTNKQGGADGEFYHLTVADYTNKILNQSFGDVGGGNYTQFNSKGEVRLFGEATQWNDLRFPAISTKASGSKQPSEINVFDNGSGSQGVISYAFDPSTEEELYFVAQMPHSWKQGSNIEAHVHWFSKNNGSVGQKVSWGLEYTWSNIGGIFGNTAIIYGNENHLSEDIVSNKHYLTELGNIDSAGKTFSSMLICRIFRDATGAGAVDNFTNDAILLEIDFHYQIDSFGSNEEYVKY